MSWFYAEGGQQRGPITDQELQALVQSGRITGSTLVWREGMPEWRPYATVVAPPPPPGAVAAEPALVMSGPTAVCAECGRVVPAADTVALQGRTVCASCKPQVVQRMMEGADGAGGYAADGSGPFDPEAFLAELRARGGFRVEIGRSISRGFDLVNGNFWPCVGNAALVYLITIAVSMLPLGLGIIGQLVTTGPLTGGLFYYMLLQVRRQPATINETFSGFRQPLFVRLMLAGLLVQIVPIMIGVALVVPVVLGLQFASPQPSEEMLMWLIPVVLIAIPLSLYYYAITMPCYVIIADTGVSFWEGIKLGVRLVHMRLLSFLGFGIVCWLLLMAGFLLFCVGFFWMLPVVVAACAHVWSDLRNTVAAHPSAAAAGNVRWTT
jgi:hypothetical protein